MIPADHFQCYEIKPASFPPTTVTVQDRFGTQVELLRFPHRLCAPADKNGSGIMDPVQHLAGYETRATPFVKVTSQTITNQFGTLVLDLTRRDNLLVPSAKSLSGPATPLQPPTIDHFQCYRVRKSRGQPGFAKVTASITDQFESASITLLRPFRLCVPANKNGEDPTAPMHDGLLLCYTSRSGMTFGTMSANINNQFGDDELTLIHRRELCVPSKLQ
jgi:hypothetical protein